MSERAKGKGKRQKEEGKRQKGDLSVTRVLYLTYGSQPGGAELQLLSTIDGLDRTRFEPFVVLRDEGPLSAALTARGVRWTLLPCLSYLLRGARAPRVAIANAIGLVRGAAAIRRLMAAERIDLVHAFVEPAIKYAAVTSLVTGVPAVCTLHEGLLPPYGRLHRIALAACLRRAFVRVITPSHANRALLLAAGVPASSVETIHNGGAEMVRLPSLAARSAARRRFGLPPAAVVVGLVGRFDPLKGHDVLVRAVAALAGRQPAVYALLVGEALLDGEARHRENVVGLARTLGVDDRIHLTGFLDDVSEAYAAMDLLAHPCVTHDTLPGAIIEAMASGLPVVGSRVGGIPEIIDPDVGVLLPAGEPAALADAIHELAADPERRAAAGAHNRGRALRLFSRERYQDALTRVYIDAAATRRPAGLTRAALANGTARGVAVVITALQAAVLTRHLPLPAYGVATSLAWLGVTGLVTAAIGARIGNEMAAIRAQDGDAGGARNLELLLGTITLLGAGALVVIGAAMTAWPYLPWTRLINTTDPILFEQARHSVAAAAGAQLLGAPFGVVVFAFRAYDETIDLARLTAAAAVLGFLAATAGATIAPSLPLVAAAPWIASGAVSLVATLVFVRRRGWPIAVPGFRQAWSTLRPLATGALQFAALGGLFGVLTTTSSYAVSVTQGFESAARVDLYGKILLAALIVQGEMLHPLWPVYARYHVDGQAAGIRKLFGYSLAAGLALVAAASVFVGLAGRSIVHLLTGQDLPLDRGALAGLIAYAAAFGALQPTLTVFNATNRLPEALASLALGVCVAAVATVVGGRWLGPAGALAGLAMGLTSVTLALIPRLPHGTESTHAR